MHAACFFINLDIDNVKLIHQVIAAGASSFGNELAYKLSATNATVVILDRGNSEANASLVQRINDSGEEAHFYECDITNRLLVHSTIDAIEREIGVVTMVFYGNMLEVGQQSDKLLKPSYVNVRFSSCSNFNPNFDISFFFSVDWHNSSSHANSQ